MTTIRLRFTFSTDSEAWDAMRAMDAAGFWAGYPELRTRPGVTVLVPADRKADAVDLAFGCGSFGYAEV